MPLNIILFIIAVYLSFSFGFLLLPFLILLFIAGFLTYYFKNYLLIPFLILGIAAGFYSGTKYRNNLINLPEKGFVNTELQITDFPELRSDGQYQVHSGSIKILSTNAYALYKSQTVNIKGYITIFNFGNRKYANLNAKYIEISKNGFTLFKTVSQIRKWVNDRISKLNNNNIKSLLYCMILANTNFVDFSTNETFKMTGVTHLLAISGLNVAIVGIGIVYLLKLFMKERSAYGIASLVIIAYVAVAGFGASIMRAGLMFLIYNSLKMTGRITEFMDILLISAFVVLLFNPEYIINAGFWLSYSAVAGIYFFTDSIRNYLSFTGKHISEILAVTISANISTMPILLYFFKGISIISPAANLIIIPAFNLLTYLLFIEFIFIAVGFNYLNPVLEFFIGFLWNFSQKAAEILSFVPFSYQTLPSFPIFYLIILYIIILIIFFVIPKIKYYKKINYLKKALDSGK